MILTEVILTSDINSIEIILVLTLFLIGFVELFGVKYFWPIYYRFGFLSISEKYKNKIDFLIFFSYFRRIVNHKNVCIYTIN